MEEQTEGKEEGSVEQQERRDGSRAHQERRCWGREGTSGVYGEKICHPTACADAEAVLLNQVCVLWGVFALWNRKQWILLQVQEILDNCIHSLLLGLNCPAFDRITAVSRGLCLRLYYKPIAQKAPRCSLQLSKKFRGWDTVLQCGEVDFLSYLPHLE